MVWKLSNNVMEELILREKEQQVPQLYRELRNMRFSIMSNRIGNGGEESVPMVNHWKLLSYSIIWHLFHMEHTMPLSWVTSSLGEQYQRCAIFSLKTLLSISYWVWWEKRIWTFGDFFGRTILVSQAENIPDREQFVDTITPRVYKPHPMLMTSWPDRWWCSKDKKFNGQIYQGNKNKRSLNSHYVYRLIRTGIN